MGIGPIEDTPAKPKQGKEVIQMRSHGIMADLAKVSVSMAVFAGMLVGAWVLVFWGTG